MRNILNPERIMAGIKLFLQLSPPGKNLPVRPDDVFIVSYPKSGNTWTRFLIANLVYPGKEPDFGNIDRLIPGPEVMSRRDFDRLPSPRIIRTHSWFNPAFKKVIYIVRDPRDIVVSQFHYHRKRKVIPGTCTIESFVTEFLVGETDRGNGSWKQNVASWVAARFGDPSFLLLRYEDMITDTRRELTKIAGFLGVPAAPERIEAAVQRSTADRMRRSEQAEGNQCALIKDTRPDIPFVRSAKSGSWKSELPQGCVEQIERRWSGWIRWLGYELSSSTVAKDSDFTVPVAFADIAK